MRGSSLTSFQLVEKVVALKTPQDEGSRIGPVGEKGLHVNNFTSSY